MKNKVLFFIAAALLLLISGCNNDSFFEEPSDVVLKKANVPIPSKGEICMTYNYDVPLMHVEGTPYGPVPEVHISGSAWLSGHMTHMGKLDNQSYMTGISAKLDKDALAQGKVIILAVYESFVFGASGDYSVCLSHIIIDATDPEIRTISGFWEVTGGSGKYENSVGSGMLSGTLPCWYMDGTVEYPRDK